MQVGKALFEAVSFESESGNCRFHATNRWTEKEALALFLDGEVSAVIGHAHALQTADERIMPGGTAYITYRDDGPVDSALHEKGNRDQPQPHADAAEGCEVQDSPAEIQGLISIDTATGKAISIEAVRQLSAVLDAKGAPEKCARSRRKCARSRRKCARSRYCRS